jgi:hypothetical protein
MDMRVDEARQDGAAGKIEALAGAGRSGEQTLLDGLDPIAGNPKEWALPHGGAGAVEEAICGY